MSGDELAPLFECMCFHVRSAARAVTKHYDRALAPAGVKITQFALLAGIRAAGAVTMQQLAGAMHLDPSTMTRTLQPLVDGGLIRITPGEDRRHREISLTVKGAETLTQAREGWDSAQQALQEKLGPERFTRLIDDMREVLSTLHR